MAVVTDPQPPARTGAPSTPDGGRRRVVAMAIWGAAFLAAWLAIGLPTDPAYAFVWIWAGTIAWHSARPWRSHLRFARDWIPVVLLLAGYNLSRGFADNGATPHALELIVADRFLVGWATGGEVPTIWLQQHLYRPEVQWWDVLVSWIYFSHFVATLAAAAVLWLRDRSRWGAYMRRWGFLFAAGLATYFLYPAAPPWWAGQNGLLGEVARISTRGWKEIGMHGAGNLLNAGQIASNPVAAMPSLHTAFALFVVLFFMSSTRKRWWPLLLAYPLAMTFTLLYSGEHYLIDVLVGWTYVGLTVLVVGLAERGWAAYRSRRPAPVAVAAPQPPAAVAGARPAPVTAAGPTVAAVTNGTAAAGNGVVPAIDATPAAAGNGAPATGTGDAPGAAADGSADTAVVPADR